jgi:hypothetical protein
MGALKNGLFAQTRRYAQKFIIGISTICLRKNFRLPRSLRLPDLEQKSSFFKAPL